MNKPLILDKDNLPNYEVYSLENYLIDVLSPETFGVVREKMKVIIQGLELDTSMPIFFIYLNFAYMDNYLYITLFDKSK